MSVIEVHQEAGVALVTLNRPDAHNALNRALSEAIITTFADLAADEGVRAIVLTGSGRAFCAGVDLKALTDEPELLSSGLGLGPESPIVVALEQCPQPIIGAVNGAAVTGGFELALACDYLFASKHARFADTHARVGILPGWGLSQKLMRLVGASLAKEISLTGNFISAEQALAWGLINHLVAPEDLLDKARALAADMLSCVPDTLAAYKALMDDGFAMNFADGMALEQSRSRAANRQVGADDVEARRQAIQQRGQQQK